MKGIIALLMIGICLQSSWARPFETDCGEEGGSLSHLIAKIPVIGRRLLEKKSCSEAPFTKVLGIYVKKESIYDTFSECCSSCLKVDTCVAWSFNEHAKACKVYDKDGQFYQTTAKHHTSGILTSRLDEVTTPGSDDYTDDSYRTPVVDPAPPPESGDLVNKVIYGRRLNSHLPCRGNLAGTVDDCKSQCSSTDECAAWTFTPEFNCGWIGEPRPLGLCYLMADVDANNIFDAPDGDSFVSGWI